MLGWALPQCQRIPFKESEQPQFGSYILVGLCLLVKKTKATIMMAKQQMKRQNINDDDKTTKGNENTSHGNTKSDKMIKRQRDNQNIRQDDETLHLTMISRIKVG